MESPDLVVFTGDMLSGYAWNGERGWAKTLHDRVVAPCEEARVPWAIAIGNHDTEADLTAYEIIELDKQRPLSLT
jgi:hypothetical protein